MSKIYTTFDSPIGELFLIVEGGIVTGLYNAEKIIQREELGEFDASLRYHPASTALHRYFMSGKEIEVPVNIKGNDFQKKVWAAVQSIPFGKTKTFQEVIELMNTNVTAKSLLLALEENPLAIIVPCHRVIAPTAEEEYSGGCKSRDFLLYFEATHLNKLD